MIRSIARLRLNSNSINDHHNIEPAVIKQNNYDSGDNYLFHDHTHSPLTPSVSLIYIILKGGYWNHTARSELQQNQKIQKQNKQQNVFVIVAVWASVLLKTCSSSPPPPPLFTDMADLAK